VDAHIDFLDGRYKMDLLGAGLLSGFLCGWDLFLFYLFQIERDKPRENYGISAVSVTKAASIPSSWTD
jgi:hypothetical protein